MCEVEWLWPLSWSVKRPGHIQNNLLTESVVSGWRRFLLRRGDLLQLKKGKFLFVLIYIYIYIYIFIYIYIYNW